MQTFIIKTKNGHEPGFLGDDMPERNFEESARRELCGRINAAAAEREQLESEFGQVWDREQLLAAFVVHGFMAPYCIVQRRSNEAFGTLCFQHSPRFYFDFQEGETK
jgi:hypothetical protein